MIRLLKKQEVDRLKALEKKRDIDEGMKLAKRVDSLREIEANEEEHLRKFREQTVNQINNEIFSLVAEKNRLSAELVSLKSDKDLLDKHIGKEWEKWKSSKQRTDEAKLVESLLDFSAKSQNLDKKEQEFLTKTRELASEKEKLEIEKNKSLENFLDSERLKQQANKILKEAENEKEKVLLDLKERREIVSIKEKDLVYRENDLQSKQRQIDIDKAEIAAERLHIISQQSSLKTALEHIRSLKK